MSLGTSVPTMLAAIVGSALGPGGAAAAAGATGGGIEASMSMATDLEKVLIEGGVDVSSPEGHRWVSWRRTPRHSTGWCGRR
jgi:hypothetical protein